MAKLCTANFTSNSTWTAPAGVTKVLLIGHGGGAGGSGGRNTTGWGALGGNGTVPYMVEIDVVPNTTYTITIGTGGAGGVAQSGTGIKNGGAGGDTIFGSLYTFYGAPNAWTASTNKAYVVLSPGNIYTTGTGNLAFEKCTASSGYINTTTASNDVGSYLGGGAGAPGWLAGAGGGTGGNGNNSGTGGAGGTGSGRGAGGGGGGAGSTAGGAGGNGFAGQLQIAWIE